MNPSKALANLRNYQWRKASQVPRAWAPTFGERVDWLEKRLGRPPRPGDILEDAEDKDSPIHHMFDWDDEEAAMKFRRIQAGVMLTALVVKVEIVKGKVVEQVEMPVRVALNHTRKAGGAERPHISDVLNSREMRGQILERAADELLSIERRYAYLKELSRVFQEVDVVIDKKLPHLKKERRPVTRTS